MDKIIIELRTRTDRPGKEPIYTAEKLTVFPSTLLLFNRGDNSGLHRELDQLAVRARACAAADKSAEELAQEAHGT